jgi:AraC-like DNA-binding protein
LLVVVAIILIALHIYLRQKRTIEKAYQELAGRISRNIRLEDEIIRSQARDQGTTLQLAEKLEFRMQQDKPYLNGDLTVNDLAAMLNTNQTYISNLLNQQCGLNFNEYINQQRVKEFCRLIDDGAIESLSIDQLSERSGFKTRSTFYTAFRKFTGMTPAAFISARKEICVQLQSSVS